MQVSHRIFATSSYEKWGLVENDRSVGFIDVIFGDVNNIYLILTKTATVNINEAKEFAEVFPEFLGSDAKSIISIFIGSETEVVFEPE